MEASGNASDPYANLSPNTRGGGIGGVGVGDSSRRGLGMLQIPALNILQSPLSFVLEYSGIVPARSAQREGDGVVAVNGGAVAAPDSPRISVENCAGTSGSGGDSAEVSIRIIGGGEQEERSAQSRGNDGGGGEGCANGDGGGGLLRMSASDDQPSSARSDVVAAAAEGERTPLVPSSPSAAVPGNPQQQNDDSSYQSYDIHQIAKWIEQILPFSILLLVVFIRQHLQGFFVTIWISAVMYKSNDIVRRQTSLKGERKSFILAGIFIAFMLHVVGIYWWFRNDDLLYPLAMLPPKSVPPFWHAVFIVLVNDTLMRQAAMAVKCLVLIYYKNGRGYNFRRQGQMLTLIEYTLLLYRAMLPTPVWYRFFLNKDNGSLFSSLTTGLYLTFKLTSVVEKVQSFLSAAKALSRREVNYGSRATPEQVSVAGDLCAICQEKMHSPILLRCKHIFCEDCVSEWFERERTCPLCRALVKPPDLRTFGDGSTNLLFQLF
ncbi:RING finger and transmembrane domain-containing protein 2 [Morus notabilis]|uniref:RING finger and transmembrane domain-containing protein 2 n=1 Tax=Morus notabilis TaxID=981085 RepID=W9S1M8_9ROSA|nr:RING finger and transmembrane domain-containing protein 2 [Morus notabilis]EXC21104.1 RING finger and transmembrane domain-containing protein 2 [Morus notabilis]